MSAISRLLPAFNRLSVQPSTLRLARSYATQTKVASPKVAAKKTTPAKKAPAKKVDAGKKTSAKTTKKSGEIKKSEKPAATPKPKPKPKRLETVLTKMPVSGRSAWALFVQANKHQYLDTPREPGKKFSIADVTNELSKQWKELPEADRKVFNDRAVEDKIRAQTERAKLLATASAKDFRTENSLRRAEGKVTIKDPNAPKKPKNPFMYFSMAQRQKGADGADGSITEFQKGLGEIWRGMSDSQKEPYNKQSANDRARYLSEMKAYDPDRFLPKTPKAEKAGKAAN